jgi:hypothetical protein
MFSLTYLAGLKAVLIYMLTIPVLQLPFPCVALGKYRIKRPSKGFPNQQLASACVSVVQVPVNVPSERPQTVVKAWCVSKPYITRILVFRAGHRYSPGKVGELDTRGVSSEPMQSCTFGEAWQIIRGDTRTTYLFLAREVG